jgi:hypothetical protein
MRDFRYFLAVAEVLARKLADVDRNSFSLGILSAGYLQLQFIVYRY